MRLHRLVLLLAALGILSGCGFQLRSQWALPSFLQPMAVTLPTGNRLLEREVLDGLDILGANTAAGGYRLVVLPETVERQTAVVDNRAKAAEYQLSYLLRWSVVRDDKSTALSERVIRIRRSYQYDTTAVVGKAAEEVTLVNEMRHEAVQTLMRQLTLVRPTQLLPAPAP